MSDTESAETRRRISLRTTRMVAFSDGVFAIAATLLVLVPPAYTSMTCSECGEKQARLGLADRTFHCLDCGYTAARDHNAARVILATAEQGRAGADDVRHSLASFPGASGVRSEPEISRL